MFQCRTLLLKIVIVATKMRSIHVNGKIFGESFGVIYRLHMWIIKENNNDNKNNHRKLNGAAEGRPPPRVHTRPCPWTYFVPHINQNHLHFSFHSILFYNCRSTRQFDVLIMDTFRWRMSMCVRVCVRLCATGRDVLCSNKQSTDSTCILSSGRTTIILYPKG